MPVFAEDFKVKTMTLTTKIPVWWNIHPSREKQTRNKIQRMLEGKCREEK